MDFPDVRASTILAIQCAPVTTPTASESSALAGIAKCMADAAHQIIGSTVLVAAVETAVVVGKFSVMIYLRTNFYYVNKFLRIPMCFLRILRRIFFV